jgi:hypothetical protein
VGQHNATNLLQCPIQWPAINLHPGCQLFQTKLPIGHLITMFLCSNKLVRLKIIVIVFFYHLDLKRVELFFSCRPLPPFFMTIAHDLQLT